MITIDSTEAEIEAYWVQRMEQRMVEFWELIILENAMKGFYYEGRDEQRVDNMIDWMDTKRPLGNKSVDQSVMFNLCWDRDRTLCLVEPPKWVEDEAMRMFDLLRERLIEKSRA